ncbi:predicted protein [Arabidopsis lyrata subsp. lyrata]|uniref:Predicted protein n=1 Tax=Arabidopsis lyrata subsp. lyrata TaxID=81972 RepID=D7MXH4_ARALL|nr:predicted protein [Arabidopsis lyrata subsp. lyrata]
MSALVRFFSVLSRITSDQASSDSLCNQIILPAVSHDVIVPIFFLFVFHTKNIF